MTAANVDVCLRHRPSWIYRGPSGDGNARSMVPQAPEAVLRGFAVHVTELHPRRRTCTVRTLVSISLPAWRISRRAAFTRSCSESSSGNSVRATRTCSRVLSSRVTSSRSIICFRLFGCVSRFVPSALSARSSSGAVVNSGQAERLLSSPQSSAEVRPGQVSVPDGGKTWRAAGGYRRELPR
jgi:hypothetical protein